MNGLWRKVLWLPVVAILMAGNMPAGHAAVWGADYFPNVELVTQDGTTKHFFDELIKDKVVLINFIYTTCVDTCPMETAQLVQVQRILGDRLGRDVFFYSITIDPEHDTPQVLKDYREMFGARWTFLTGDNADIIALRRKLGLYIEEIQDGSNNHNVNMIIGNQATGRWMKRSPFENPHVLADQLGNWLTDWKSPPRGESYANAPLLRTVSRGEQLFRTRCAICHTLTGVEPEGALGPDLLGVTGRREANWLLNWLRAPDQMLAAEDPTATALLAAYNNLPMPNLRLNQQEATDLLDYISDETKRLTGSQVLIQASVSDAQSDSAPSEDLVATMNTWIREANPAAGANAGYMTIINVGAKDLKLVEIRSPAFDTIEMHETTVVDGAMKMRQLDSLVIPANGQVSFLPGGQHLMMKGPREQMTVGHAVDMTLIFDSGARQNLSVRVVAR